MLLPWAGAVIADGEGNAENANRLGGILGENYLPEKITGLTGAKSYEYAAPMASVARPSFAGRTVQEGTPSPDTPAPIKGVLNPWAAAYTGEPVEVAADVEPMMVLPDGTQDRIVLRDGVWGIERNTVKFVLDGSKNHIISTPPKNFELAHFYTIDLKSKIDLFPYGGGMADKFGPPITWDEEYFFVNGNPVPEIVIKKSRLTGWSEELTNNEKAALFKNWISENPVTCYSRLNNPDFEPVPAWNGFGKIEPIVVTTSITKPNPDAPISPDNVAAITGTPVVTTGYRGQLRQLTAELFKGDSFDGVNLTTNGTVSRHDMDLPLSPGNYTIEAGDENGLLESVSIEILPDSAVYGRRVYPYQHIKEGTVHKLSGTPGAAQIIFNATDVYQDGDTWMLNGAAVSVTYADGQTLLPTAVIAGDAVQAVVEREAVKHIAGVIMPEENLLDNWDFRNPAYTFDKLETAGSVTAEKQAGYIMLNFGDDTSTWGNFSHLYESAELVRGKELTFSALCRATTNESYIFMNAHTGSGAFSVTKIVCDGQWRVVTCTGIVPDMAQKLSFTINGNIGAMEIACIKVEIGPNFTGWHEPKFDEIRLMMQKPTPQKAILDNSLFDSEHLVNQRNQNIYNAAYAYAVDRWIFYGGSNSINTLTVEPDGIILTASTASVAAWCRQFLFGNFHVGQRFTTAIQAKAITPNSKILLKCSNADDLEQGEDLAMFAPSDASATFVHTFSMPYSHPAFEFIVFANSSAKVERVKLELGPRFTGWYEPKPGETLAECQRYYIKTRVSRVPFCIMGPKDIDLAIKLPVPMRLKNPVISSFTINNWLMHQGKNYDFDGQAIEITDCWVLPDGSTQIDGNIPIHVILGKALTNPVTGSMGTIASVEIALNAEV